MLQTLTFDVFFIDLSSHVQNANSMKTEDYPNSSDVKQMDDFKNGRRRPVRKSAKRNMQGKIPGLVRFYLFFIELTIYYRLLILPVPCLHFTKPLPHNQTHDDAWQTFTFDCR